MKIVKSLPFRLLLAFDANGTALMLAVFALQDSFGTACNVTGDGALTLMLTGYAEKHGSGRRRRRQTIYYPGLKARTAPGSLPWR